MRGRHYLILWLALFLGVAAAVVTRQTASLATAARIRQLGTQREELLARRGDVERRVRAATSREVLQRVAQERLGLRIATDSDLVLLDPAARAGDAR
ncbi:MAG: hypothetical protein NW201_12225 [Gemmatimonadales bacterium]|nr:hypothetical protein [Gemmatimonadales bacterium]